MNDDSKITPGHATVAGVAIVMTCACSTSAQAARALGLVGLGVTRSIAHPIFLGLGAALILYGLWHVARRYALVGAAAFVVLAVAMMLTPFSAMSTSVSTTHHSLPWAAPQMWGAALYVAAGVMLAYAFWRAFPMRSPAASATAMGGMVLATGCACCLISGAAAGMAVTAGASVTYMEQMQLAYWLGLAAVIVGLYRLGGAKAAAWALVGGIVGRVATGISLAPTSGVNWLQFGKYAVAFAGMLSLTYGFVVAYRMAHISAPERARPARPEMKSLEPVTGD